MAGSRKNYKADLLFALTMFIVFLVVFESKLVIPQWLQPVGRMHALILHFPIVLVLLAMLMEFFRYKTDYQTNPFYQRFTSNILLAGVVFSGVAVIMGIFLSKEAGYNTSVLSWHKWSGVSVFFFASAMYAWRHAAWYKNPIARVGAVITTLCLISAGHFGAALTHGDNFIWQPVIAEEQGSVPLEEALVFDHVIKPVLEKKCISCHNAEKLKGQLMLTDSASIWKGGKSGELFVPGKPEMSLLIKRLNLPLDEKKHMPPSGKPQLTDEEHAIFYHWIQSGAAFNTRVTALPESDTLRIVAIKLLEPAGDQQEVFPFPAVAQQTLQQLNSNYRVVSPLAKNSPALTVNVYNKETYTPGALDELKEVKEQIISLDLGKMPVKDEDLKFIVRFKNLRRLNLNFTEITGEGLQRLSALEDLEDLSVSGTRVTYSELARLIPALKNLRTLSIWETALSVSDIRELEDRFRYLAIHGGVTGDDIPLIKLNPPRLKNKSPVFKDSIVPQLYHPVKDVDIRFTTDGSEPDSLSSPLFNGNAVLKASTQIKARAFKKGWLSSDVAVLNIYSSALEPDTAVLLSKLNRVHTAKGAQTFFDHELGSFNANSPAWANNWAGFIKNDMELLVQFNTARPVTSVAINSLIETENSIFPPATIEVWGGTSGNNLHLIYRSAAELPTTYSKPFIKLYECGFEAVTVSHLKIIARPVRKLPGWHKRKDSPALMLVDEILIN